MTLPDVPAMAVTASPRTTADALASGAVVRWWQSSTFLDVAGPDALDLLDGLCTQAVARIEPGTAVLGLFLDAKARIVAPAILHRGLDTTWTEPRRGTEHEGAPRLWLETLPELVEPLRAHLVRYRLRAKASIEPSSACGVAIVGAHAAAVVVAEDLDGTWTYVLAQARPTVAFTGSAGDCARLVRELLPAAGLMLADPDALEADRIEAGVAGLHDLLPGRMPAEVGGMAVAVALDAGCYLGQEPVARLHYRGRANRSLRHLACEAAVVPGPTGDDPDAALALKLPDAETGARAPGRLTTWARRPDGTTVALAVLRREIAEGDELALAGAPGTRLRAVDGPPD